MGIKVVALLLGRGRIEAGFLVLFVVLVERALVFLVLCHAGSVRSVFGAVEMDHAVDAGKGGTSAAASVWVELLLGEDVAAVLLC